MLSANQTEDMTDIELLNLAAKAAGIEEEYGAISGVGILWNPLCNDGHALQLAVKLGIDIEHSKAGHCVIAQNQDGDWVKENFGENGIDPFTATRRAIVRVAAKLVSKSDGNDRCSSINHPSNDKGTQHGN